MKFAKQCSYLVLTASLLSAGGCGPMETIDLGRLFAPEPTQYRAYGLVFDDTALLMPGRALERGLAGVRVEIASGPGAGRSTISDGYGQYDLGAVAVGVQLRASKDGWSTVEEALGPTGAMPHFYLGQAPHVLWGTVGYSGGSPSTSGGIRAEIIDGPDAGKLAVWVGMSQYSFEDLSTQPQFVIEFSRPGYQTTRLQVGLLNRNQRMQMVVLRAQ